MIRPLRDLLLLRVLPQERTKVGHLFMPQTGDAALANNVECEVLAAGPGTYRHVKPWQPGRPEPRKVFVPTTCKAGDTVFIKCYDGKPAGEKVEHGGETLVLIRERDILGLVVPEAAA